MRKMQMNEAQATCASSTLGSKGPGYGGNHRVSSRQRGIVLPALPNPRAYSRLEPYVAKVPSTVPRGEGGCKGTLSPDYEEEHIKQQEQEKEQQKRPDQGSPKEDPQ